MTDTEFRSATAIIKKLTGIHFPESKKYLVESRLERRLHEIKDEYGIRTIDQYLSFVDSLKGVNELQHLYKMVTINETFFFRSPQQVETIENILIPELIKNKPAGSGSIKFWSAASSSGEEVYTLAMVVNERFIPYYPKINFVFDASDIDHNVLTKAKLGEYKPYSVRNIPTNYLDKHFKKNEDVSILSEKVKNLVTFRHANLTNPRDIIQFRGADIVLLSNVLIYFDQETKEKVLSSIYTNMARGGYLFIGYSESLQGIKHNFEVIHHSKTIVYKKN